MDSNEDDDMLSKLQLLRTEVEQKINSSSRELEDALLHAVNATSEIINTNLPTDLGSKWLEELSSFKPIPPKNEISDSAAGKSRGSPMPSSRMIVNNSDTLPSLSTKMCMCGIVVPSEARKSENEEHSAIKRRECIHGCGTIFHSAQCRRRHTRAHSEKCPALVRKKVLKNIGLSSDPELF